MKIKQLSFRGILVLSLASLLSSFAASVSPLVLAESERGSILAITTYKTTKDFDLLLANSKRVLAYYSGEEVDKPVMLHILTREQHKALTEKKYVIKVIKENPDMEQYRLFYLIDPQEVEKLKQLGEVQQLSSRYALVMVGKGKTISAQTSALKVMPAPFLDLVVSTNKKTKVYASPPGLATQSGQPTNTVAILIGVLLLLTIAAAGGFLFYRKRKQAANSSHDIYVDVPNTPQSDQPPTA